MHTRISSKGAIVASEWMIDADAHKEGQLNIESDSDPSLPSSSNANRVIVPAKPCQDHAANVANIQWIDDGNCFASARLLQVMKIHCPRLIMEILGMCRNYISQS